MVKTILKIDGMACSMCEAHVNDAVRRAFNVKKVTSSHKKGICEIITESEPDTSALISAVEATGYRVLSVESAPYVKKGLFSRG